MSQLYALPGFMPPESPKDDARVIQEWSLPVDVLVYTEDSSLPEKPAEWYLEVEGYGTKLLLQRGSTDVYPVIEGGNREYRLRLPAKILPAGTHRLEVRIGVEDQTRVTKYITVPRTLGNTAQTTDLFAVGSSAADQLGPQAYVTLYNPDTGTYYKVAVSGLDELAQITLQEL